MSVKSSKAKPKRCPFCRGLNVSSTAVDCFGWFAVFCWRKHCRVRGPRRKSERAAIKAWNAPAGFVREP